MASLTPATAHPAREIPGKAPKLPPMQIPDRLRRTLEPLPTPVRFSDGRVRLSTMRLGLLTRVWSQIPACAAESQRALAVYDGGDVLDIGAFHGWYSVLLTPRAQPDDRLVSFEPDSGAIPTLRKNLADLRRLFPRVNLSIVEQPVGDGKPVIAAWPSTDGGHPVFRRGTGSAARPSMTIDAVVADRQLRPRLIKIDVEGAEPFVLEGMRDTLREHRPVVILEVHPTWLPEGVKSAEVEALLTDLGYRLTESDDAPPACRQVWRPHTVAVASRDHPSKVGR